MSSVASGEAGDEDTRSLPHDASVASLTSAANSIPDSDLTSVSRLQQQEQDDEDSDDDEPRLKYERLPSPDVYDLLSSSHSASCLATHPRVVALGTYRGKVHLMDALGNLLGQRPENQRPQNHTQKVTQVSLDHAGEYVASSSLCGRVCVRGLVTSEHDHDVDVNEVGQRARQTRPALSVSLDPIFARSGTGRRFLTGDDDRVLMHEKGFLNRYKPVVICEGEGPVGNIVWRGRFAAWTCRKGVRVYDVVEAKIIALIKSPPAHQHLMRQQGEVTEVPFRFAWSDQFHLFVAMRDTIRVCHIKKRDPVEAKNKALPEYFVELTSSFVLDVWVCGIAPFEKQGMLAALTVQKSASVQDGDSSSKTGGDGDASSKTGGGDGGKGNGPRVKLQVIEPLKEDGEYNEVSTDVLTVRGYASYQPRDYDLCFLREETSFLIVAPKDVVQAVVRDPDDRLAWMLEREKFAEALQAAERHKKVLTKYTVIGVGRQYLNHLLGEARFEDAGRLCVRLFSGNRQLWQEEVYKFARLKQLRSLAPFLPRGRPGRPDQGVALDSQVYELALREFLAAGDSKGFLKLVRDDWPPELYCVSAVVTPVVDALLVNPEDQDLQRALATLFSFQGKYDKAMAVLLKLGHEDVFQLIRRHELYEAVAEDKIMDLMNLNQDEALKLFLDNLNKLPPSLVVSRLRGSEWHTYKYLDALLDVDYEESKKFHGTLVTLYADFAHPKLLPFLRSSDYYPIAEALEICRERCYVDEQIYVLGRMGSTREALALITDSLVDIHKAVDFCKEYDDAELWEDLIERSIDKPYFVHVLLHNIGTHVDPRILIEKIEHGHEIPGLRDSLVQIIHDYRLQVSLQEGCQRILVSDCHSLLGRLVRDRARGLRVPQDCTCGSCGDRIIPEDEERQDLVVYNCRHVFHVKCVGVKVGGSAGLCGICHKRKEMQRQD